MKKSLIVIASIVAGCTVGCDVSSTPTNDILTILSNLADILGGSLFDAVVALV